VRSADTNVVGRFLADDDVAQAETARRWFRQGEVFVSQTVLVETEWVLRSVLGWKRARVARSLSTLLRGAMVVVERSSDALWAVDRHAAGADFADMLHLAAARRGAVFATFDRTLVRDAGASSPVPVETLR